MTYCNGSPYRNNSCGCNNSSGSDCGSSVCGCNSNGIYNFPPRPSDCRTCPPGTFSCPCRPPYPPFYPPYQPCSGGGNTTPPARAGSFAFLNSSGSTVTTGSVLPLRYVLGTGNLARDTTGGTVNLDSGVYTGVYSLSGTAPATGMTITVTPEYGGTLHSELSRSITSTAAGETFELSGVIGATLPTDTTLSLNVTISGDATETGITGVNASMILNKLCDIIS